MTEATHRLTAAHVRAHFPDAAYFTPEMIAAAAGIRAHRVRYYCRQLFPRHEGHYRFWAHGGALGLSEDDLELVLKTLCQSLKNSKA